VEHFIMDIFGVTIQPPGASTLVSIRRPQRRLLNQRLARRLNSNTEDIHDEMFHTSQQKSSPGTNEQ
jgi:hypothetical protein